MHYGTNYKITSKYKPKKRQFVKKKTLVKSHVEFCETQQ